MKGKSYDLERRQEFIKIPLDTLFDMIKRLPHAGQLKVRETLPSAKVSGFRYDHEQTLLAQLKKFMEYISLRVETGKSWECVKSFWIAWVQALPSVARGVATLQEILEQFDNDADFKGGTEAPANSTLDIRCFEYLLEASSRCQIDRESISQFYLIGHFRRDSRIEELISRCRDHQQIADHYEITQRMSALEDKLGPISEIAEDFATATFEQNEALIAHENTLKEMSGQMNICERQLEELSSSIETIRHEVGSLRNNIKNSRLDKQTIEAAIDHQKLASAVQKVLNIPKLVEVRLNELVNTMGPRSVSKKAIPADRPVRIMPPYPSEGEFIKFLDHRLKSRGVLDASDSSFAAYLYGSLHVAAISILSHSQAALALRESLNAEDLFSVAVEPGWFNSDWADSISATLPALSAGLRGLPGSQDNTDEYSAVLSFEDFDRSFPEAYLLSCLKNYARGKLGNNLAFMMASRSQDDVHVVPNSTFFRFACDLDMVLMRSSAFIRPSDGPSICRVSHAQWRLWRDAAGDIPSSSEATLKTAAEILHAIAFPDLEGLLEMAQHWLRIVSRHLSEEKSLMGLILVILFPAVASRGGSQQQIMEVFNSTRLKDVEFNALIQKFHKMYRPIVVRNGE